MNSSNSENYEVGSGEFPAPARGLSVPGSSRVMIQQPVVASIPVPSDSETSEIDVSRFLHSLRRNWLLGAVLGIIAAVPLTYLMWTFNSNVFTATEVVHIAQTHAVLVFETADSVGRFDFKGYKNTQRQLLMQSFVLNSALKNPEVASLSAVRNHPDPVSWLQKDLKITFPDEAEIMSVSLTDKDPMVAHVVLRAVLDAYMKDVVEKERAERLRRVERLEKILVEAEDKVRKKRGELSGLVDSLGTGDSSTLNLAQQSSLQQFSLLRAELSKINFELMRAKGELLARNSMQPSSGQAAPAADAKPKEKETGSAAKPPQIGATSENVTPVASELKQSIAAIVTQPDTVETPLTEIDAILLREALDADPAASRLLKEIEHLQGLVKVAGVKYVEKTAAPYIKDYETRIAEARKKLAERTKTVQRLMQEPSAASTLSRSENLPLQIEVLQRQELELRSEMKDLENEAKKFGRSSIDVEMMRKEIDGLDPVVARVSQEIERTKIELQSASRIKLYETSGVPQRGFNKKRIPLTAAAALLGLFGPLALLMLRDFLRNHVNHAGMINTGMNISVLGSIPRVPSSVMRRLSDPSDKTAKQWRERVSESVTAVTAMLLRRLAAEGHRVILISSAMPGEGKSTLAEQLARSLANSGHRTLLIDFDLRRPMLHRRFGIPLAPGLGNVLREGADLKATVRETDSSNLSILTAGNCDGSLLLEAANGTMEKLFAECRAEYELVVVDSSPLLPVVDGRIVGQFTDGGILTVVKDTSKIPQIVAARNIMADYGIAVFGCVVHGDNNDAYYKSYGASAEAPGPLARGINATRSMSAM